MASLDARIISIGTLAAHPLWEESSPVRTGHATCTLVTAGDVKMLINPGLPSQAMAARLSERSPVKHTDITHVFVTTFTAEHYRGILAFEGAKWLLHEPEIQAAGEALRRQFEAARDSGDPETEKLARTHLDVLERCGEAPDKIAPGIDLFPLPGVSPGTCGILLPMPVQTLLVCGDAVATREHADQAKVLPGCVDVETAMESFKEAVEIADLIVPGRDNLMTNPARRGF